MPLLSVTRLRIRSPWFLPTFFIYSFQSLKQARKSDGNLAAKTLADAHLTFWTVSLWTDETAMRRYMTSGAHKKAMPYLQRWCIEAATGNTTIDAASIPAADVLYNVVRLSGRPSKLLRPNENHLKGIIAKPVFR